MFVFFLFNLWSLVDLSFSDLKDFFSFFVNLLVCCRSNWELCCEKMGKRKQVKTEQGEEKKRKKGENKGEKTKRKKEEKLVEKGKEEEEETERKECEERRGFECLICFEMMRWEREPRSLPCGHSFCSDCLNKLFFSSQQTSTSTSISESGDGDGDGGSGGGGGNGGPNLFLSPLQVGGSSSSSSSSCCLNDGGKKKRCCPVCRKEIEGEGGGRCETIESFDSNYLIPETIDVIESSKIPSFCIPPTPCFSFFFIFFCVFK